MFHDSRLIHALNDPVLRPLIGSRGEADRAHEIELLIVREAMPVIERVLQGCRTVQPGLQESDFEDAAATVALHLTRKLQALPDSVDEAIRDFDDYVAATTLNVFRDLQRRISPLRARMERRLRFLLTHDPRLALWSSPAGGLCGLSAWTDSNGFTAAGPSWTADGPDVTAQSIVSLFRRVGQPMLFETLVTAAALAWNVVDQPSLVLIDSVIDERPGQAAAAESRQLMDLLWREILELPSHQRIALLLNLREAIGINAIMLFPLTGVADISALAAALGMSETELAAIWNDLPLDDLRIGSLMNVTRQQVINYRKSARERLQRRLAKRHYPER